MGKVTGALSKKTPAYVRPLNINNVVVVFVVVVCVVVIFVMIKFVLVPFVVVTLVEFFVVAPIPYFRITFSHQKSPFPTI